MDKFVGKPDDKIVPVQMHYDMLQRLKLLAIKKNMSVAELCRQGAEYILSTYEDKK